MEKMRIKRTISRASVIQLLILFAGTVCNIFLSPKWMFPLAAWIGPACFLLFIQYKKGRQKWFWLFMALLLSQTAATYDVIPMPLPILLIMATVNSLIAFLLYCIYDWFCRKTDHFAGTLIFPATWVTWEYWNSFGGGGVWGAIANTQFTFSYLAQLASVTGIWGISFLVYWWNAVFVWCMKRQKEHGSYKKALAVYASIFLIVMVYGIGRLHLPVEAKGVKKIKAAGIALSQLESMELLYEDVTGKKIKIAPTVSQSSPELQEFNKAFTRMLENPDTLKYKRSFVAVQEFNDSLFTLTKAAASKGAKLVLWAEANALIYPWMEAGFVAKGRSIARQQSIYLLMAYVVLTPGKIIPGKKFMENKTVFIEPDGKLLNTFFKNKPVPYAESSVAGDGKIPLINTAFGKAAVSICYDADFPGLMKQLGKSGADFLLLPSGDWFAISPHHTYMALYRGIENGCPIIRDVKGGLSVAADHRGKIYSASDFYQPNKGQWIFELPVGHVNTVYTVTGDVVAYSAVLVMAAAILFMVTDIVKRKFIKR